jgi:hypothetical protein
VARKTYEERHEDFLNGALLKLSMRYVFDNNRDWRGHGEKRKRVVLKSGNRVLETASYS